MGISTITVPGKAVGAGAALPLSIVAAAPALAGAGAQAAAAAATAAAAAQAALAAANDKPRFKLVLLVCAQHEDDVPEADWLRWLDAECGDVELHVNLSVSRWGHESAIAAFPRVTFGHLTSRRLERVLPPANLLQVCLCGSPSFVADVRSLYLRMGLPRALICIAG